MPADISNKSATSHRSSYAVSMKEARNQAEKSLRKEILMNMQFLKNEMMCFLNVLSFFSSSKTQKYYQNWKPREVHGMIMTDIWEKLENSVKIFPTIQEYDQCQNFLNLKYNKQSIIQILLDNN